MLILNSLGNPVKMKLYQQKKNEAQTLKFPIPLRNRIIKMSKPKATRFFNFIFLLIFYYFIFYIYINKINKEMQ